MFNLQLGLQYLRLLLALVQRSASTSVRASLPITIGPLEGYYPDFLRVVRCQASTRTGLHSVGAVIREYWPQCTENGKGNDRGKKRGQLGVR